MRASAGRRVDRWIAVCAFGLVAIVMAGFALLTTAPELAAARRDPQAATDLVALMRAGEQTDYIVDYTFTRTRAGGGQLHADQIDARFGKSFFSRAGAVLDVDSPRRAFHCQIVDDKPSCYSQAAHSSLPASAVVDTAVRTGAYDVTRLADRTIAGTPARCFRVHAHFGLPVLPALGSETISCLTPEGVPVRSRITNPVAVDERVATRVERHVDDAALTRLLADFDQNKP